MGEALRVEAVWKRFGGVAAVTGPSFGIGEAAITALIGPNGSGKTTMFNLITGVLAPDEGRILVGGVDVTGWPPHRVTGAGVARTFQISRVFGQLTVWENMLVCARGRPDPELRTMAGELLTRVGLYEDREKLGDDLSFGQHRLLEVVRALMLQPRVLMLDEPFAGVNPTMGQTIQALLRDLRAEAKTVFLIDHAMSIIMGLCDRVLVMDGGALIADGTPAEVQSNEQVLEAYFGRRRSRDLVAARDASDASKG